MLRQEKCEDTGGIGKRRKYFHKGAIVLLAIPKRVNGHDLDGADPDDAGGGILCAGGFEVEEDE